MNVKLLNLLSLIAVVGYGFSTYAAGEENNGRRTRLFPAGDRLNPELHERLVLGSNGAHDLELGNGSLMSAEFTDEVWSNILNCNQDFLNTAFAKDFPPLRHSEQSILKEFFIRLRNVPNTKLLEIIKFFYNLSKNSARENGIHYMLRDLTNLIKAVETMNKNLFEASLSKFSPKSENNGVWTIAQESRKTRNPESFLQIATENDEPILIKIKILLALNMVVNSLLEPYTKGKVSLPKKFLEYMEDFRHKNLLHFGLVLAPAVIYLGGLAMSLYIDIPHKDLIILSALLYTAIFVGYGSRLFEEKFFTLRSRDTRLKLIRYENIEPEVKRLANGTSTPNAVLDSINFNDSTVSNLAE